jgi:glutamate--cysteine ligase
LLRQGLKGLEKESLRLAEDGSLAQTPHPASLGSALTHPWITTDYSEALIELISPPFADPARTLGFLEDVHGFVARNIGGEFLLATSMPVGIGDGDSIPIAHYGRSNIARMKNVYRRGLGFRYGRMMQAIAGVHFNYSVAEPLWPVLQSLEGNVEPLSKFIADRYFGMVRNIHRYGWLLIHLFGHSPAVCRAFFSGRERVPKGFRELDTETLFRPNATSLRMSDIGYRNDSQAGLAISFDSLDDYVASLTSAIAQPYPPYETIGVRRDGEYLQLNANILQIENEYYSSVRPKQTAKSGEKPTLALKRRGVQYLELRLLDLDCYAPAGVSLEQLLFLETFVLLCLFKDSPPLGPGENSETSRNVLSTACCGRGDGFRLHRGSQPIRLRDWAMELIDEMSLVAEALDYELPGQPYARSLDRQKAIAARPEQVPSARMELEMRDRRESFQEFAWRHSRAYAGHWRGRPPEPGQDELFRSAVTRSLDEQAAIEARDELPFEEFLQRYFAQA